MINISDYDYQLDDERIAKFPLESRDESKLLVYKNGSIKETVFKSLTSELESNGLVVFNNSKVIRARLVFFKSTGARIEIFCLEPHSPADYESAFSVKGSSEWRCIVGNLKKWKEEPLEIILPEKKITLRAHKINTDGQNCVIKFKWNDNLTFGQVLEVLGKTPIPPYLNRDSQEIDNSRYQTVYSKIEGSVAAPTAGLHFTENVISELQKQGTDIAEVTLHVGAGTFLPVKEEDATKHPMHTEMFRITIDTIEKLIKHYGKITAVGTTTVRTLESISVIGSRIINNKNISGVIEQWEWKEVKENGLELMQAIRNFMIYNNLQYIDSSTCIMIIPRYKFKIIDSIVTNFHQPKSTLLLLISAVVGGNWTNIYDYALSHNFRFLSYGDSSLIFVDKSAK